MEKLISEELVSMEAPTWMTPYSSDSDRISEELVSMEVGFISMLFVVSIKKFQKN